MVNLNYTYEFTLLVSENGILPVPRDRNRILLEVLVMFKVQLDDTMSHQGGTGRSRGERACRMMPFMVSVIAPT